MKILVLGHRGMAGHVLSDFLSKNSDFNIVNSDELIKNKFNLLTDINQLHEILKEKPVNYIVNCIGLLKKKCAENPVNAIKINSLFPYQLVQIANEINAQVIHLSTDCYMDNDVYGRSKRAGEINYDNHLTIRTSIIGPELKKNGEGLFSWFMSQTDTIDGYTNVLWDGITTLELAKFIQSYILNENKLYGIKNLRSDTPISKYSLLQLMNSIYEKNIDIRKFDNEYSDKTEKNEFIQYKIPSYQTMIQELHDYFNKDN